MITILLVDDQNLVQQGIKSLLERDPEIEVIGTVEDGRNAVKQVIKLRPDIILLDIEMPGMDGITATKYITRHAPDTKVIILSSHDDNKYVTHALMAGAKAYILKSSLMADLRQSIIAVNNGYTQIESRLLAKIFDSDRNKQRNSAKIKRSENSANLSQSSVKQEGRWAKSVAAKKASPQDNSTQVIANQPTAANTPDPAIANQSESKTKPLERKNSLSAEPKATLPHEIEKSDDLPLKSQHEIAAQASRFLTKTKDKSRSVHYLNSDNSSSQLPLTSTSTTKKSFIVTLKNHPYVRRLSESPIGEKSQTVFAEWWDESKTYYEPALERCQVQFAKYRTRLLPVLQHWQSRGWLTIVGLVFLSSIAVIVIHNIFF